MTTLTDRDSTALFVIDVQEGVVVSVHRRDEVVTTISGLVERARQVGVPVVRVQHSDAELEIGSDAWQIVPELTTEDLSAWGAPTPDAVIAHTTMYWQFQGAPGRTAGVSEAAEVDFSVSKSLD